MDEKKGFTLNAMDDDALENVAGGLSGSVYDLTGSQRETYVMQLRARYGDEYDTYFDSNGLPWSTNGSFSTGTSDSSSNSFTGGPTSGVHIDRHGHATVTYRHRHN